jgi:hypothetical protein
VRLINLFYDRIYMVVSASIQEGWPRDRLVDHMLEW